MFVPPGGRPDLRSGYARFSLSLVRHPPEVPYTGDWVIERPSAAAPFLHRLLELEPYECFGALLLTARNHPIGHTIPYWGTLTSCRVEPRAVLLPALMTNAASMIAFHAHPSGDPTPSPEDRAFARRLDEAGKVVGVEVKDFLVLGEAPTYWSQSQGLSNRPAPVSRKRQKRRPKYRHPEDPSSTWAGTGHMPVWLREEIEAGAFLEDFLVDGAEVTPGAARQARKIREGAVQGKVAEL
jgi:hypothetical protein